MKNIITSQDVRQDHKGRLYRVQHYESGRLYGYLYVDPPTAETPIGYTVPKPPETVARRTTLTVKNKNVQNRAILEFRIRGKKEIRTLNTDSVAAAQVLVDYDLRPLMRWTGKDWVVVANGLADYYVQRHEVVDA